MSKVYNCLHCHELISHVDKTALPEGAKSAFWAGWYHLDPAKEHFRKVGWYDIEWSR